MKPLDGFTPVSSDHIQAAKYDSGERRATIRFHNGSEYHVHGMLPEEYREFIEAPSQGAHYHSNIKNNYFIVRVK